MCPVVGFPVQEIDGHGESPKKGHKDEHLSSEEKLREMGHQETLCHCEDDWALAQVTQVGCGVSIPRDIKNPAGQGPGQPGVGGPA